MSSLFISVEWNGRIPQVIPMEDIRPQPDAIDGEENRPQDREPHVLRALVKTN